jgi:hypothetical protein
MAIDGKSTLAIASSSSPLSIKDELELSLVLFRAVLASHFSILTHAPSSLGLHRQAVAGRP